MVWIRGLLPILCASVLANGKDNNVNSINLPNGSIMVNTSTSDLTEAEGNTYVPGPGFFQETVIDKLPAKTFQPLPGLGNNIVIVSESKQIKDGEENVVISKVLTVTKEPRPSINDFMHGTEVFQGPSHQNFEGADWEHTFD
ncbi:uncharacterized protein LOC26526753 [Drosophila erecta]|uniref:DUF4794 domain-containing protein n=1 Tax=Drosophila erecta TaxID=7220 RepID=A0A0Q5U674_DROER|nr:uncharacterized protein LOC26526753 [Drosophila erecta]KQS43676.1 uncharacterized protein Dere_GG26929 [Drosophila erecta]